MSWKARTSKIVHGRVPAHEILGRRRETQVAGESLHVAAGLRPYCLDGRVDRRLRSAIDDDRSALARERRRDRVADAGRAPGDESDFLR